jgi:membrane-associated phospholipid phosphatase
MNREHMTIEQVYEQFGQLITSGELFYDWLGFNKWLFLAINHIRGNTYDHIMVALTRLGDHKHFLYVLCGLLVCAIIGFLIKKIQHRAGMKQYVLRWVGVFVVIAIAALVNRPMVAALKDYYALPRPYVALMPVSPLLENPDEKVHLLEEKSPEDANRSFPSGHVAFVTLIVVALWPVLSANMSFVGVLLIFAVGWSRVSLGAHFPADVVGTFLLIALTTFLLRRLIYWLLFRLFRISC